MASLVGKAQEDDDTFWSHPVWGETGGGFSKGKKRKRDGDGDSSSDDDDDSAESDGEGSYRMSEDDSSAAADQFDSDFNESESSSDSDGEGEEEVDLRAQERKDAASKRKKNQRLSGQITTAVGLHVKSAGRELMKRKSGKGSGVAKRGPRGEGWNAGLVLNWPPQQQQQVGGAVGVLHASAALPTAISALPTASPQSTTLTSQATTIPDAVAPTSVAFTQSTPAATTIQSQPTASAVPTQTDTNNLAPPLLPAPVATKSLSKSPTRKRNLRAGTLSKTIATSQSIAKSEQLTQQRQAVISEKKHHQKRHFTQEELILEAVKITEAENAKWLNARKRSKEEATKMENTLAGNGKKTSMGATPVSRFHSRRGCSNTLTFMDMDHLPEILTRQHNSLSGASLGESSSSAMPVSKRRSPGKTDRKSAEAPKAVEKNVTKCAITGKVARYRDPKTMLGYYDIDAFKELRRRLEAGELSISIPDRKSKKSQSSPVPVEKSSSATATTHFPFAEDKPTMSAKTPAGSEVAVMVTQGGLPVSPPEKLATIASATVNAIDSKVLPVSNSQQKAKKNSVSSLKPLQIVSSSQLGSGKPNATTGETDNVALSELKATAVRQTEPKPTPIQVPAKLETKESAEEKQDQSIPPPPSVTTADETKALTNKVGNDPIVSDDVPSQATIQTSINGKAESSIRSGMSTRKRKAPKSIASDVTPSTRKRPSVST